MRWRLKSSAWWLFTQPFVKVRIKENIKVPRHWPFVREFTGHRWIPAQKASYLENISIWWRHHGRENGFATDFPGIHFPTMVYIRIWHAPLITLLFPMGCILLTLYSCALQIDISCLNVHIEFHLNDTWLRKGLWRRNQHIILYSHICLVIFPVRCGSIYMFVLYVMTHEKQAIAYIN